MSEEEKRCDICSGGNIWRVQKERYFCRTCCENGFAHYYNLLQIVIQDSGILGLLADIDKSIYED